jgi:succinate dehydrogenase / fumarate reductase flavoprotein subunit/L-aspartate oxidase
MGEPLCADVLVVGSGASGLAAAVSAERAGADVVLCAKASLQSCNSAKAQGGIQAAFGADDSPALHAEDVWRSSHETADKGLVRVLTSEAPDTIHWLEGAGVEFTRDNGGYRLARCGGSSRKRLLQVGDRTGLAITRALREVVSASSTRALPKSPLLELEPRQSGWRARCGDDVVDAGAVVLAAGGRCFREARERRELTTNHPGATGEVTEIALGLGAEARDLDALQYHPNGGAWPRTVQGYSIPETTRAYGAVLLNAEGEEFTDSLGPRDEVSRRSSTRWTRAWASRPPTAVRPCGSTRPGSPRTTRPCRCRTCSAATAPTASTRSPSRCSPTRCSTTRTAGS